MDDANLQSTDGKMSAFTENKQQQKTKEERKKKKLQSSMHAFLTL